MTANSDIVWTHHTFNPWTGCTKVSAAFMASPALGIVLSVIALADLAYTHWR